MWCSRYNNISVWIILFGSILTVHLLFWHLVLIGTGWFQAVPTGFRLVPSSSKQFWPDSNQNHLESGWNRLEPVGIWSELLGTNWFRSEPAGHSKVLWPFQISSEWGISETYTLVIVTWRWTTDLHGGNGKPLVHETNNLSWFCPRTLQYSTIVWISWHKICSICCIAV